MVCLFVGVAVVVTLYPHVSFADDFGGIGGDALSQRVGGLTNKIIGTILPAISTLGLVYSAILAASGDQGAKPRMVLIIIASCVGFLAPLVIRWFQGAVGAGGLF
jgi:hypothetical protein